jgi:hypothetical protein
MPSSARVSPQTFTVQMTGAVSVVAQGARIEAIRLSTDSPFVQAHHELLRPAR